MEKLKGSRWYRSVLAIFILLPALLASFEMEAGAALNPDLVRHCYGQDRVMGENSANVALCSNPANGDLIVIQVVTNGQSFGL